MIVYKFQHLQVYWALSDRLKAVDTSIAAWPIALKNRAIAENLVFHRSGDPVGLWCSVCLY